MTVPRWVLSLALVTSAALTVACSTGEAPRGGPFPPRPVAVDSSTIAPCDLLSESQRSQLGLDDGSPGTATVNGRPSPGCVWLGDGAVDYNAQFVPVDAALATTEPGATIIAVNGSGAVRSVPAETFGGTPLCQVTVDAAAGQTIRVQASTRPGEPPIGIEAQCRLATEAASMVMTTVVATTSR